MTPRLKFCSLLSIVHMCHLPQDQVLPQSMWVRGRRHTWWAVTDQAISSIIEYPKINSTLLFGIMSLNRVIMRHWKLQHKTFSQLKKKEKALVIPWFRLTQQIFFRTYWVLGAELSIDNTQNQRSNLDSLEV